MPPPLLPCLFLKKLRYETHSSFRFEAIRSKRFQSEILFYISSNLVWSQSQHVFNIFFN